METAQASSTSPEGQCCSDNDKHSLISVGQRIDRICGAARLAIKCGSVAVGEVRSILDIDGRVDRNPYTMMAAAAGSGYILGGGLFSPLTARIVDLGLRLGVRLAAIPFIQRELLDFTVSACDGGEGSASHVQRAQYVKVTNQRRYCYESETTEKTGQRPDS